MSSYFYDMKGEKKKTYTYTTLPSIKEKAKKKAFKEGMTLSEKIDELLKEYVKKRAPYPKSNVVYPYLP
jgi:hypothetical protein